MRKWMSLLVMVALLAAGRPARADTAPLIAVGPTLQPMDSTTVRMESEQIEISLRRAPGQPGAELSTEAVADYRIRFHFVPTADETMQAGFPLWIIRATSGLMGAHLEDFTAVVGGQKLPVTVQRLPYNKEQTDWAVFTLAFQKGQPLDLEVAYALRVSPFGKSSGSDLWVSYILQTGAYWAGTIGKAEATVKLDRPLRREDIRPPSQNFGGTTPGWTLVDGALHWEWRDLEPDFDLSVQLANTYWLDLPDDIRALIDAGVKSRDDLARIWYGTEILFAGNGRSGLWEQVRGGSAEQVGETLLPDVLKLMTDYLSRHPDDTEMQGHYLRLLYDSSLHPVLDSKQQYIFSLYNEDRYRTWLAEARKSPTAFSQQSFPWFTQRTAAHLSEAGQAETAAALLALMPAGFPSEAEARRWAESAAGVESPVLTGQHAQSLLDAALQRVAPPAPPAADTAPAPQPPATAPQPQDPAPAPAPDAPTGSGWLLWTAAGSAALAVLAYLWTRRRHTATPNGGR